MQKPKDIGLKIGTKKQKRLEDIKETIENEMMGAEIAKEMNEVLIKKVNEMIEKEKKVLNT